MTKKQAKARKLAWQKALAEGRVVRFDNVSLTSYPTVDQANVAVKRIVDAGLNGEIVKV